MQEKQHSRSAAGGAAPNSNVLLSVDEILGLVNDDDHHDEYPSPSPLFLRSDSLGETPVPTPPVPKRAQTWHAMPSKNNIRSSSKVETNHRVYRNATASAATNKDDDDDNTMEVDEVSQDGSMTTNAPKSPSIPTNPHGPFQRGLQQPSRPSRTPSPDSDLRRNVPNPQQQQQQTQYRPNIVESCIAPFSNRDSERNQHKTTARSSWPPPYYNPNGTNTNKNKKKPTSRFEIFENKLREEEGIFGILL